MIRLWPAKQQPASEPIRATATVEILATDDANKPATVRITAYTDRQEMTVPGYGRVAIAIEGMQLGETLPLLTDHENKINAVAPLASKAGSSSSKA